MNVQNALPVLTRALDLVLNLFYPNLCVLCEYRTHSKDELFCMDCQYHIHPTGMHERQENEFTAHFKARIDIIHGAALYYYVKGGRLQKAIELLKYKNRPEIGLRIGRFYGSLLNQIPEYRQIDLIVPVPLHPKQLNRRGYNQSGLFASGIAEQLHIPVDPNFLKRKIDTSTQTERNRIERMVNMQAAFDIKAVHTAYKHILLVDDILTTGATLEACAGVIQKKTGAKISMVTIAMAT